MLHQLHWNSCQVRQRGTCEHLVADMRRKVVQTRVGPIIVFASIQDQNYSRGTGKIIFSIFSS